MKAYETAYKLLEKYQKSLMIFEYCNWKFTELTSSMWISFSLIENYAIENLFKVSTSQTIAIE